MTKYRFTYEKIRSIAAMVLIILQYLSQITVGKGTFEIYYNFQSRRFHNTNKKYNEYIQIWRFKS